MNATSPPGRTRHRAAVLAVQLLATSIVVPILVTGGSACSSTTTEIGSRGAARLFQLKEWRAVYYSIELPTVPLDRPGTYTLRVSDLEASVGGWLYLDVVGAPSIASPAVGIRSKVPVVRVRLRNRNGDVDVTRTFGAGALPWAVSDGSASLRAEFKLWNEQEKRYEEPGRDFTIRVEVLRPSGVPGQCLKISTCWNA